MLQRVKGVDMGASRAGASATLLPSGGSGNFMTRNDGGIGDAVLHHQSGVAISIATKPIKRSEWENLSAPAKTERLNLPHRPSRPAISRANKVVLVRRGGELVDTATLRVVVPIRLTVQVLPRYQYSQKRDAEKAFFVC